MPQISVALDGEHGMLGAARAWADMNTRDLANCTGHAFVKHGRVAPFYRCNNCKGVADAAYVAQAGHPT